MSAYPVYDTANEREAAAKAALLAKMQVIHENATRNLGALLNGDADKEYIWANASSESLAGMMGWGYQIVKDPKEKKDNPTVSIQWRQPDYTFRRGDLILMSINKETHQYRKLYSELKGMQHVVDARKSILNKARQAGIRVELMNEDGATVS